MRDFFYRLFRWLVAIAFTAVVLFVIYRFFPWQVFRFDQLDPRLPEAFHYGDSAWVFWGWVVLFLVAAATAAIRLRAVFFRARTAQGSAKPSEPQARASDADGPGDGEIAFPPGTEPTDPIYIFLSTSEGPIWELFRAAGAVTKGNVVLTTQPQRAVLVNAARSSLLFQGDDGADPGPGLESLCQNLLRRDPEYPWLRGIFVVLPLDELERADPSSWARRVHADLQTVRRVMQLEVPTHLLITRMETVPGFIEFAKLRGPHESRQGRWGVSLSRRSDHEDDPAWRSLVDFRFRVRRWTTELLVKDLLDSDRNARLLALEGRLGSLFSRLAALIAGAFPAAEPDRPFLRTIDLVATGAKPEHQAYLLASIYLPVFEDQAATRWTSFALAEDHKHRRRAAAIAASVGTTTLGLWLYIQLGLGALGYWGWIILIALAGVWVFTLVILWRRWPRSPVERTT